ncbi:MAG: hypothetical protein KBT63_08050 [Porticoccaceae bacterium]|nr:hypothetical protein [Porticoccaceae bacterium]
MNKVQTHNGSHSRLQRVSHCALVAVFLFSIVNPVMAGMNNMVMGTAMDMSVEVHINMSQDMAEATYEANSEANSEASSEDMDCEQECNCCPGLCSAYLPISYTSAVFSVEKFVHNKIIINAEAIAIATLFRPPIIR